MYGYIYKITNTVNGKQYIGQRARDFYKDTAYLGSGILIKTAVKKYGKEFFIKELIEECDSKEELDDRELFWISEYDAVSNPEFYNLAYGANGSAKGSKRSDFCKRRMSESQRGKTLSEEQKKKISKTISSQLWVNNGEVETKATEETLNEYLDSGYVLGRLQFSEEARTHMSEAFTGRHHTEETKKLLSTKTSGTNNGFYGKTHSKESKKKMSQKAIGRKATEDTKKLLSKQRLGRRWINNGTDNKFVRPEDLSKYLAEGWIIGILK